MTDPKDIDYGPLAVLIGTWEGDKGLDIAPEPDGTEENPYYETISFEPLGDVTNAEDQVLTVLRYLQVVRRKSDDEIFHDQTGYWTWDAREGVITESLSIPRAVSVLAGGRYDASAAQGAVVTLKVAAKLDDPDWGVLQSPYMRDNARTLEFRHEIAVEGDRLTYSQTTVLDIYGRRFDHTDENVLTLKG